MAERQFLVSAKSVMKKIILVAGAIFLGTLVGFYFARHHGGSTLPFSRHAVASASGMAVTPHDPSADRHGNIGESVVKAAREQVGQTICYDPAYRKLPYPNGDLPIDRGVCTDVLIRALRRGLGMDLQKLVYEDMSRNFSQYPQKWGLSAPDTNIDHRRVPNLQVYFARKGCSLAVTDKAADYKPGDFVTCIVPPNLPHIMIVGDATNSKGQPLIIHNIGAGAKEEDRLFEFKLTGHYRLKLLNQQSR